MIFSTLLAISVSLLSKDQYKYVTVPDWCSNITGKVFNSEIRGEDAIFIDEAMHENYEIGRDLRWAYTTEHTKSIVHDYNLYLMLTNSYHNTLGGRKIITYVNTFPTNRYVFVPYSYVDENYRGEILANALYDGYVDHVSPTGSVEQSTGFPLETSNMVVVIKHLLTKNRKVYRTDDNLNTSTIKMTGGSVIGGQLRWNIERQKFEQEGDSTYGPSYTTNSFELFSSYKKFVAYKTAGIAWSKNDEDEWYYIDRRIGISKYEDYTIQNPQRPYINIANSFTLSIPKGMTVLEVKAYLCGDYSIYRFDNENVVRNEINEFAYEADSRLQGNMLKILQSSDSLFVSVCNASGDGVLIMDDVVSRLNNVPYPDHPEEYEGEIIRRYNSDMCSESRRVKVHYVMLFIKVKANAYST